MGASASSSSRPPWSSLSFSSRAEHSMPWLSTPRSLPSLICERLAVLAGRQFGADQRGRHRMPTGVGRAADDVQQGALPHVHLAHAQAVGVGMLDGFLDLAHHDLGEGRRDGTRSSTSSPPMVSTSAICWVDSGGLQNSRSQDSGIAWCRGVR
jgi:hypothetical protein